MEGISIFFVGIWLVLIATGLIFAQEKAKSGGSAEAVKAAEPAKPTEATKRSEGKAEALKKEAPPKPVEYRMGGIITAVDPGGEKITIRQRQAEKERTVTLVLGKEAAKKLSDLKIGDAVDVWIRGKIITHLNEVGS